MARILTFEQRDKCKKDLQEKHKKLKHILTEHSSLGVCSSNVREWNVQNGDDSYKIYEIKYYIQKTGRKLTWNDVYKLINSVEAVPYSFMSGRVVNGEVRAGS